MNKITTLLFTLLICLSITTHAQREDRNERLKTMKIGFITQRLDLTVKEAEKFWPIYNAHQEKMEQYRAEKKNFRKDSHKKRDFKTISNKEAEELLNSIIELDTKIHQEEINLYKNLKGVLPATKLLILHKTENDFNRKILEKLRSGRKGPR